MIVDTDIHNKKHLNYGALPSIAEEGKISQGTGESDSLIDPTNNATDGKKQLKRHRSQRHKPPPRRLFYVFVVLVILFLVGVLIYSMYHYFQEAQSCLGPPYIYVTQSESRNIMKFSRNGCLMVEKVLYGYPGVYSSTSVSSTTGNQFLLKSLGSLLSAFSSSLLSSSSPATSETQLRSMLLASYRGKLSLYIANTDKLAGILLFGQCSRLFSGRRPYIKQIVNGETNLGAYHGYGLTQDHNHNIYGSFQNTDLVLGFEKDSFKPLQFPPKLKSLKNPIPHNDSNNDNNDDFLNNNDDFGRKLSDSDFFEGTFVQFGLAGMHNKDQGIRSILWVKNSTQLWVANEDWDKVVIINKSGKMINYINIRHPIGLTQSMKHKDLVFVSSKGSKKLKNGAVYAINTNNYQIVKTFKLIGLAHPTGVVTYNDILYVADQSLNLVVAFNITNQNFIRVIIGSDHFKKDGDVEQIILSDC
eukprot:gene15164-20427_t